MSAKNTEHYERLLDAAERHGRCLAPSSPSARRYLDRQVAHEKLVRPFRGVYARSASWRMLTPLQQHLHIVRALAFEHPDWVFSHFTAAVAYGLSVSYADIGSIHRIVPKHAPRSSSRGVSCHAAPKRTAHLVGGINVTSFEQTVSDCLCSLDFAHGVALADSALRISGMTGMQLCELLDAYVADGTHGIVTARRAACFADGRAESGGESIARARMLELGFMIPNLQVEFPDPIDSRKVYRVDFCWNTPDGRTIIGELDGRDKYADPVKTGGRKTVDVLADERLRESRLSMHKHPIMRFSFRDALDGSVFRQLLVGFGIPYLRRRANGEPVLLVRGKDMVFKGIGCRVWRIYPVAA